MFNEMIAALNKNVSDTITKDRIAEILKVSPEKLAQFEASYQKDAIDYNDGSLFSVSSRKLGKLIQSMSKNKKLSPELTAYQETLENRIVDELLTQTPVFEYDGKAVSEYMTIEPDGHTIPVTREDVAKLPVGVRPQLTGNLSTIEIKDATSNVLMFYLDKILNGTAGEAKVAYNQFRQGLDLLDVDGLTYRIIDQNQNSMGHWLPELIDANADKHFFKIPKTIITKVPLTMLQLTRLDYMNLTQSTLNIVDKWAQKAFKLDENKEYFIRTGTHSSKFDFRNAHVHDPNEVREIGQYLTFIHNQGVIMAGYDLSPDPNAKRRPVCYGMSTTVEWVVREFIKDTENNPEIYKGLPLHTEYRVFIDCDTKQVLSIAPYWDPKTMTQRFLTHEDANSPHQIHDYVIYKAHEDTLMNRYEANKDLVKAKIQEMLPDLNLTGQWSLDVMQNGNDFWLIDMAIAKNSAFYETVPAELRNPQPENWIPEL